MSVIGIILLSYLGIGLLIGLIWVYCDDFSFLDDPAEAKCVFIILTTFLWVMCLRYSPYRVYGLSIKAQKNYKEI